MTVTVRPDPFTLIAYDAAEIAAIVAATAERVGLPADQAIEVEVDEELFAPIVGHLTDVVDGVVKIWISGGNLEDSRRPRNLAPEQARRDFTLALLRAKDRLSAGFADAPEDAGLTRGERAAWDVSANGRAERLGVAVRRPAQRYDYRLQLGFTDVADAAFERLWAADEITWADIRAVCVETGADERSASKIPVDILRRR